MKYAKTNEPKCLQEKTDCFANYADNRCRILEDTHFNRECPFYKEENKLKEKGD